MTPSSPRRLLWALACLAAGLALLLAANARASAAPVPDVCAGLLRTWRPAVDPARLATCERLAGMAEVEQVPVGLALALAYHETHLDPAPRRLCGPLQIAPRWHCPGRVRAGCDCERAGVQALGRLLSECEGSERCALRRWLVGPRGARGALDGAREAWIGAVLGTRDAIERALAREGGEA
jgi:hypothetical protein